MCLADSMDVGELTPVEETALLTEYARALDSRSPRSILGDTLAEGVVGKIDYDFAGLGVISSVVCLVALRAKMLDERIRAFITEHPYAVVVDLGAGLNSAVFRVDPPPTVDWYSVDLPAVIKLRDAVLPHRDRSHSVAASVAESGLGRRNSRRSAGDGSRRRPVRFPQRARYRHGLAANHRPFRVRYGRVQRLRHRQPGKSLRGQACNGEEADVQSAGAHRSHPTASGSSQGSRTRIIPRPGIPR